MNIAEIRTTIHHLLQRAALRVHCPDANLPRAVKVLDSLLRDELAHVGYTAVLLERKADADSNRFPALFRKRLRDFNETTCEEPIELSYHQRFGNYP